MFSRGVNGRRAGQGATLVGLKQARWPPSWLLHIGSLLANAVASCSLEMGAPVGSPNDRKTKSCLSVPRWISMSFLRSAKVASFTTLSLLMNLPGFSFVASHFTYTSIRASMFSSLAGFMFSFKDSACWSGTWIALAFSGVARNTVSGIAGTRVL
uniref:Uncharacterized protein n=1 Tax=Opuntia streptacantha TaxID=393608 RepID=A0A7C9CYR4_OPUST